MRCAALVLLLGACGGKKDVAPTPEGHTEPDTDELDLRAEAVGGGHAAIVHNMTAAIVRLHRELRVERQVGATWESVDASSLFLREDCDAEPPPCVEVGAGATFRSQPWTDDVGDAQCACEECGPAGAGTYRFVVMACDDSARFDGTSFVIP